jgi:hypothetical protein
MEDIGAEGNGNEIPHLPRVKGFGTTGNSTRVANDSPE